MDKKCERCLNKKAIFNCPSCDKYHNVCESCDNFIHILNKTKYHKRQYIYIQIQIAKIIMKKMIIILVKIILAIIIKTKQHLLYQEIKICIK